MPRTPPHASGVGAQISHANQSPALTVPSLQDYALISRIRDSETGHVVVVVGGLYTYGTEAAGEFLTDPDLMEAIANQSPGQWKGAGSADRAGNDGYGRDAWTAPGARCIRRLNPFFQHHVYCI